MATGKRWGECGTTQRWHRERHFMSKFVACDEASEAEQRALERSRLIRGVCPSCAKQMGVGTIDAAGVQLLCKCGRREYAKRGTRAYKNAALLSGGR